MPRSKKLKRPFDMKAAMNKSVEGVGVHAFQTIYKAVSDGLPDKNSTRNTLWHSHVCENHLGVDDAQKVAKLALDIEDQAKKAIVKLFLHPGFIDHLTDQLVAKNARKLNRYRKPKFTAKTLFQEYFERDPANLRKPTKQSIRELEREGRLREHTDLDGRMGYLVVDADRKESEWSFVRDASIPSAFTELRKVLRPK